MRSSSIRILIFFSLMLGVFVMMSQSPPGGHKQSKDVVIYGADYCGFCVRAKKLLDQCEVRYQYRDLNASDEYREKAFCALPDGARRTIPQIFIEDFYVGGFQELNTLCTSGKIWDLIR